jgi:hypothetical protein
MSSASFSEAARAAWRAVVMDESVAVTGLLVVMKIYGDEKFLERKLWGERFGKDRAEWPRCRFSMTWTSQ